MDGWMDGWMFILWTGEVEKHPYRMIADDGGVGSEVYVDAFLRIWDLVYLFVFNNILNQTKILQK